MGELEKFVPSRASIFLEAKNKAVVYVITGILGKRCQLYGRLHPDADVRVSILRIIRARPLMDKKPKQNSEVEGLRLDVELRRRGLVTRRNALGNEGKIIGMLDQDAALGVQLVGVPIGINRNTF